MCLKNRLTLTRKPYKLVSSIYLMRDKSSFTLDASSSKNPFCRAVTTNGCARDDDTVEKYGIQNGQTVHRMSFF